MNFIKRSYLLSLSLIIFSPLAFTNETSNVFNVITERLYYMQDVALFKQHHHLPIEDIAREKKVLKKALEDAGKSGLDPESVTDFFRAQIAVAKAIQYRYRADWLSNKRIDVFTKLILLNLTHSIARQVL